MRAMACWRHCEKLTPSSRWNSRAIVRVLAPASAAQLSSESPRAGSASTASHSARRRFSSGIGTESGNGSERVISSRASAPSRVLALARDGAVVERGDHLAQERRHFHHSARGRAPPAPRSGRDTACAGTHARRSRLRASRWAAPRSPATAAPSTSNRWSRRAARRATYRRAAPTDAWCRAMRTPAGTGRERTRIGWAPVGGVFDRNVEFFELLVRFPRFGRHASPRACSRDKDPLETRW